jgi:hypothetical protein
MVIFCHGQSKVKWRDLAPQTQKTISDLAVDSAASVIQDSIAFPTDTLALQQLNMDEGRVAEVRDGAGRGKWTVIDSAYAENKSTSGYVLSHVSSGFQWLRSEWRDNKGWVNVEWYGADGTDTDSDSAAFVDALSTNRNVYVPAGSFYIKQIKMEGYSQKLTGLNMNYTNLYAYANEDTLIIMANSDQTISNFYFFTNDKYVKRVIVVGTVGNPVVGVILERLFMRQLSCHAVYGDTCRAITVGPSNSILIRNSTIVMNDINIEVNYASHNTSIEQCRLGQARFSGIRINATNTICTFNVNNCTFEYAGIHAYWKGVTDSSYSAKPIWIQSPVLQFRMSQIYVEADTLEGTHFLNVEDDVDLSLDGMYCNSIFGWHDYWASFASGKKIYVNVRNAFVNCFSGNKWGVEGIDFEPVNLDIHNSIFRTSAVRDTVGVIYNARSEDYDYTPSDQPTFEDPAGNISTEFQNIQSKGQYWRKSGIGEPSKMNHIVHFYVDSIYLGNYGSSADTILFKFWYHDSIWQHYNPFHADIRVTAVDADKDSSYWSVHKIEMGAYIHGYLAAGEDLSYFNVTKLIRNIDSDSLRIPPDSSDFYNVQTTSARYTTFDWYLYSNPNNPSGKFFIWIEGEATNLKKITWTKQ